MKPKCPKCNGMIVAAYGNKMTSPKYKKFYDERVKCVLCGRYFLKSELKKVKK